MSLEPTATPIMQPYGLPCVLSTEKQVMAKTPRKAAPIAIEANSESVIQLDGLATRGMLMSGGPIVECRNVTLIDAATNAVTVTPAQLVNGIFIFCQGAAPPVLTINLPSVADLNRFLNTNLVTEGAQLSVATASNTPRTCFRVTVIGNTSIQMGTPNIANPPGHNSSGYWAWQQNVAPADATITAIPANNNQIVTSSGVAGNKAPVDIFFIQTTGVSSDPEWLILCSN